MYEKEFIFCIDYIETFKISEVNIESTIFNFLLTIEHFNNFIKYPTKLERTLKLVGYCVYTANIYKFPKNVLWKEVL